MVVYSGPFTSIYRKMLESSWLEKIAEMKLPHDPDMTMLSFLGV